MTRTDIRLRKMLPHSTLAMENQGSIKTMYETLVRKLGAPHHMGEWGDEGEPPYCAVWWFTLENTPFSILLYGDKIPYEVTNWMVCANSHAEYNEVREFFGLEPEE